MKTCSVCEKDMEEDGKTVSALVVSLRSIPIGFSQEFSQEFLQKQMGEYQLNTDYYICYECLLRGLGVKPQ
jgi:hypothetical protein